MSNAPRPSTSSTATDRSRAVSFADRSQSPSGSTTASNHTSSPQRKSTIKKAVHKIEDYFRGQKRTRVVSAPSRPKFYSDITNSSLNFGTTEPEVTTRVFDAHSRSYSSPVQQQLDAVRHERSSSSATESSTLVGSPSISFVNPSNKIKQTRLSSSGSDASSGASIKHSPRIGVIHEYPNPSEGTTHEIKSFSSPAHSLHVVDEAEGEGEGEEETGQEEDEGESTMAIKSIADTDRDRDQDRISSVNEEDEEAMGDHSEFTEAELLGLDRHHSITGTGTSRPMNASTMSAPAVPYVHVTSHDHDDDHDYFISEHPGSASSFTASSTAPTSKEAEEEEDNEGPQNVSTLAPVSPPLDEDTLERVLLEPISYSQIVTATPRSHSLSLSFSHSSSASGHGHHDRELTPSTISPPASFSHEVPHAKDPLTGREFVPSPGSLSSSTSPGLSPPIGLGLGLGLGSPELLSARPELEHQLELDGEDALVGADVPPQLRHRHSSGPFGAGRVWSYFGVEDEDGEQEKGDGEVVKASDAGAEVEQADTAVEEVEPVTVPNPATDEVSAPASVEGDHEQASLASIEPVQAPETAEGHEEVQEHLEPPAERPTICEIDQEVPKTIEFNPNTGVDMPIVPVVDPALEVSGVDALASSKSEVARETLTTPSGNEDERTRELKLGHELDQPSLDSAELIDARSIESSALPALPALDTPSLDSGSELQQLQPDASAEHEHEQAVHGVPEPSESRSAPAPVLAPITGHVLVPILEPVPTPSEPLQEPAALSEAHPESIPLPTDSATELKIQPEPVEVHSNVEQSAAVAATETEDVKEVKEATKKIDVDVPEVVEEVEAGHDERSSPDVGGDDTLVEDSGAVHDEDVTAIAASVPLPAEEPSASVEAVEPEVVSAPTKETNDFAEAHVDTLPAAMLVAGGTVAAVAAAAASDVKEKVFSNGGDSVSATTSGDILSPDRSAVLSPDVGITGTASGLASSAPIQVAPTSDAQTKDKQHWQQEPRAQHPFPIVPLIADAKPEPETKTSTSAPNSLQRTRSSGSTRQTRRSHANRHQTHTPRRLIRTALDPDSASDSDRDAQLQFPDASESDADDSSDDEGQGLGRMGSGLGLDSGLDSGEYEDGLGLEYGGETVALSDERRTRARAGVGSYRRPAPRPWGPQVRTRTTSGVRTWVRVYSQGGMEELKPGSASGSVLLSSSSFSGLGVSGLEGEKVESAGAEANDGQEREESEFETGDDDWIEARQSISVDGPRTPLPLAPEAVFPTSDSHHHLEDPVEESGLASEVESSYMSALGEGSPAPAPEPVLAAAEPHHRQKQVETIQSAYTEPEPLITRFPYPSSPAFSTISILSSTQSMSSSTNKTLVNPSPSASQELIPDEKHGKSVTSKGLREPEKYDDAHLPDIRDYVPTARLSVEDVVRWTTFGVGLGTIYSIVIMRA